MSAISACAPAALPQTTDWLTNLGGKPVDVSKPAPPRRPRPIRAPASGRPLHRLAEVRRREGLTPEKVAKRLGISVAKLHEQEQPSSDMPLGELYRWQEALDVPIAELLHEPDIGLSPPIDWRAQLLLAMKTVRAIQERARQAAVRRLATMLVEQLVKIMPELEDTAPWPALGPRREKNDFGQAYYRRLSLDPLDEMDPPDGYY